MVVTHGEMIFPIRDARLVYLVASLTVILIFQQLYFTFLNRKTADTGISYLHGGDTEHGEVCSNDGRQCTIGVITAYWRKDRSEQAKRLCERFRLNKCVNCFIFNAFDGRSLNLSSLSALVELGDIHVSSEKKTRNGLHGFQGSGSVANVISHIELARHFLEPVNFAEEEMDKDLSCFIMLEVLFVCVLHMFVNY